MNIHSATGEIASGKTWPRETGISVRHGAHAGWTPQRDRFGFGREFVIEWPDREGSSMILTVGRRAHKDAMAGYKGTSEHTAGKLDL